MKYFNITLFSNKYLGELVMEYESSGGYTPFFETYNLGSVKPTRHIWFGGLDIMYTLPKYLNN